MCKSSNIASSKFAYTLALTNGVNLWNKNHLFRLLRQWSKRLGDFEARNCLSKSLIWEIYHLVFLLFFFLWLYWGYLVSLHSRREIILKTEPLRNPGVIVLIVSVLRKLLLFICKLFIGQGFERFLVTTVERVTRL